MKLMIRNVLALFVTTLLSSNVHAADGAYNTTVVPPKEEILKIKEDDIVIGCGDAKHFIVEYSSLSCPHCAQYYKDVFPKVKSELVNTCKAKYVYRDFPTTRSALKGVAVARCISTGKDGKIDSEEFFKFIQLLFNSQSTWAFSESYEASLGKILGLTGVSQERLSSCMGNNELMHEIVAKSFISMKALNMSRSPSIFVDSIEIPIAKFDAIRDAIK